MRFGAKCSFFSGLVVPRNNVPREEAMELVEPQAQLKEAILSDTLELESQETMQYIEPQPGPSNIYNFSNNEAVQPDLELLKTAQDNELKLELKKTTQNIEPQPGPSRISNTFSLEAVKPLPKVPPRLSTTSKRRIRKSAVLTDTPEKNALAEEKARREKGKRKSNTKDKEVAKRKIKGSVKGKGKGKGKSSDSKEPAKRRILQGDDSGTDHENDELEWYCIICCDSYSNSQPREQWIECIVCKNWAHMKCLTMDKVHSYVCPNCNSDDEILDYDYN